MPIAMHPTTEADRQCAQGIFMREAEAVQHTDMITACETEAHDGPGDFELVNIGVNSAFVMIDWSTGVQVWFIGSFLTGSGSFYVGIPANPINSGVRAVARHFRLADALAAANDLRITEARKMARRHNVALNMNGSN